MANLSPEQKAKALKAQGFNMTKAKDWLKNCLIIWGAFLALLIFLFCMYLSGQCNKVTCGRNVQYQADTLKGY